ncbi:AraC family transcriptional regulator [Marinobacterium sp. D7]|uniref:AraC family transcriptional regulator n=1 Tax=Marinobacterium ramblicola TaxID=2849041 RepID=UPI001C2DDD65|nr:AraC family transcriptional regulator [Marinobacterium ramblicola]MBV1790694.1 AraC family transcriptional regulator [Marinobacterium ramblicola]
MSFENQTVSVHYARAVADAARSGGYSVEALMRAAAINENLLESDDMRITPEQLAYLMRAAWQLEDDEFLGMAGVKSRHGVFTLMAKQAVHCKNLRGVYRHLSRFYNLCTTAFELNFSYDDRQARLSMKLSQPEYDKHHMLIDFLLLLWHRFPAWLVGNRIPLEGVYFDFPKPPHAAEYRLLFPCPAHYDQEVSGFTFSSELLTLPVVQTQETLKAHLRRAPLDWFKRQNFYPTYTRKILDALTSDERFENWQFEEIAASMAMTTRTLRRKLTEEKTSFQEIKNIARRDTAIHLLSQKNLPIASIAHQLGYSDAPSFSRAFKEWTGVTPKSYKR